MSDSKSHIAHALCAQSASLFQRGLTGGSSGNISARLGDGRFLVTPTGMSLGALAPDDLSVLAADGTHIDGPAPTKEWPLHDAFYATRVQTGAVVHLHSTYATALSVLADVDAGNVLTPITPYAIMRLGKVALLPFFLPGDAAMGDAVRALAGKHAAVLLANHGPVVSSPTLAAAVDAMEEFEEAAKLLVLTNGMKRRLLTGAQVVALVARYNVEWDT
ncbi:3-oxo-tetronate 4-phosphate decarboxylase [Roseicitreum antarcticum]|uniref:3-oxo-tetronate 4-phosphate decarboxylase n=1 Tax=Roseicitreum antarcticum TaxID=564137 RepID=A0A1H2U0G0_9RHOB|nr:aldolase [Roseicitreum antarcticum]SDW49723.1 Ribulose-5-phosphate 4-epimerase/Fuculose-1-phosphate aldolase [Roseicitreum antarcticum]